MSKSKEEISTAVPQLNLPSKLNNNILVIPENSEFDPTPRTEQEIFDYCNAESPKMNFSNINSFYIDQPWYIPINKFNNDSETNLLSGNNSVSSLDNLHD